MTATGEPLMRATRSELAARRRCEVSWRPRPFVFLIQVFDAGFVVLLLAALWAQTALAVSFDDCLDNALTQRQMDRCASAEMRLRRGELDAMLAATRARLDSNSLRTFNAADDAWENWLELECGWQRDQVQGGSIGPFVQASCKAANMRQRADRLNQMRCNEDGGHADCAGD